MEVIKMVDLHGQYLRYQTGDRCCYSTGFRIHRFHTGSACSCLASALSKYLGGIHVIPCANGTDALQIAMMALGFKPGGTRLFLPVHTYVATAEVIALLGLIPVFAEVDAQLFNIDPSRLEALITTHGGYCAGASVWPVRGYGAYSGCCKEAFITYN